MSGNYGERKMNEYYYVIEIKMFEKEIRRIKKQIKYYKTAIATNTLKVFIEKFALSRIGHLKDRITQLESAIKRLGEDNEK